MRRALGAAAALLVLAALGAALWLTRSLDARVERYLERAGSELLGTDVSLDSVDVELGAGRATLRGLEVANPEGEGLAWSDRPALRFGEIRVTIDPASLRSDPIVLPEVVVSDGFANLEVTDSGLNVLVLGRRADRADPAAADAAAGESEPRRFRVGVFRFGKGVLRADASAVGREVREIELVGFVSRNLGGAAGATPAELGRIAIGSIINNVLQKAASDRISELIEDQLDDVKEKLTEVLREALGVGKPKPQKKED